MSMKYERLAVGRVGWWVLIAIAAIFVTGPVVVVGLLGLPLLVCGVVVLLFGVTSKKGTARRAPLAVLGVLWLVVGATLFMGSGTHTSSGITATPVQYPGSTTQRSATSSEARQSP